METQNLNYEFDDVQVDVPNMQVWKAGQRLALEPKAFRVLVFLLERAGRLVEKEELLTAIWADTFVTENALTRAIALLRKVLGDSTAQAKYIETVPTRGYRFIAEVSSNRESQEAHTETAVAGEASTAAQAVGEAGIKGATEVSSLRSFLQRRVVWFCVGVIGAVLLVSLVQALRRQQRVGENPVQRTAQVTNSTALDMFPSFSPDGNTIAYCSNENGSLEIYLKQLARGGSVVQLTNDGGRNLQPAWSPDGATIAYYSHAKGGIWLIPALGGVVRQLTTFGSSPSWSPDGTRIVFVSDGLRDLNAPASVAIFSATLWIVDVKDGTTHQLTQTDNPVGAHNSPVWSPDGKTIMFTTDGFKFGPAIWTVSIDGSHLTKIADGGPFNPVYGRDGRHIYVTAEFSIWEVFLDGKRDRHGPERRKIFDSLPEMSRQLAISADGRKIAFSRVRTTSNIYSLPMSGDNTAGPPMAVTHDTRFRKTNPVVSPDGRRVLFDVGSFDRNGGIWVIDADGKNSSPVLVSCGEPKWLPGSQEFLCGSFPEMKDSTCQEEKCWGLDILKVHLATGAHELVGHIGQDADFEAYSRDGTQVAFMSQKSRTSNVWVAPLRGGEPQQVTFDSQSMGFPAWSPDGKVLAVEQKHDDNAQIWIVEPGKPPVQITNVPGQNWPSSFSPDGDKIAFAANRDGVWNLWWVSRRDHSEKQLTFYNGFNHFVRYPNWAPNGKSMVYEYAETTSNIWMLELK